MRLVNTHSLDVQSFLDNEIPSQYAILSHTWGREEVTLHDIKAGNAERMHGYRKFKQACAIAKGHGFSHIWIDTCCIDKTSSAELSEAINSMFEYYTRAAVCYTYLEDLTASNNDRDVVFGRCRWFSRGWTLQELIAPKVLIFFSAEWTPLGTKQRLAAPIAAITGIQVDVLTGEGSFLEKSVACRLSWAARRETTRIEDIAYCLLGLFDVNMPLLYGEGLKAFHRLQEQIMRLSNDHSLFAWQHSTHITMLNSENYPHRGMLASHPSQFAQSGDIVAVPHSYDPYSLTNQGLRIQLPIIKDSFHEHYTAILSCRFQDDFQGYIGVPLKQISQKDKTFARIDGWTISGRFHVTEKTMRRAKIMDLYISPNTASARAGEYLWIRSIPATNSGFEVIDFVAHPGSDKIIVPELSEDTLSFAKGHEGRRHVREFTAYPGLKRHGVPKWNKETNTLAFYGRKCVGAVRFYDSDRQIGFIVSFRIEEFTSKHDTMLKVVQSPLGEESMLTDEEWEAMIPNQPETPFDARKPGRIQKRLDIAHKKHVTVILCCSKVLGDEVWVLDITISSTFVYHRIYWYLERFVWERLQFFTRGPLLRSMIVEATSLLKENSFDAILISCAHFLWHAGLVLIASPLEASEAKSLPTPLQIFALILYSKCR